MKLLFSYLLTACAVARASGQVTTRVDTFEVLETIPHDTNAFTQGLTFDPADSSVVYESTGLYGQSDVRKVDINNGNVLALAQTPSDVFGEGMAFENGKLYHITWKSQRGFIFDPSTLETLEEFAFSTNNNEGWGITHDGNRFVVTDGSSNLHFWDTDSLAEERRVQVTKLLSQGGNPAPVSKLNEIEWDPSDGTVLANVWQTDTIVRIDPSTGRVITEYDLSNLYPNRAPSANVLNGIAISPSGDLWVTGKKWPSMYRIRLGTEASGSGGGTPTGNTDGCFSESSTVHVIGKGTVPMKELAVGDKVQTSVDGKHEKVYAFGHYAPKASAEFLQLSFAGEGSSFLEVSKEHLLYLKSKSKPVRADSLVVGDTLEGARNSMFIQDIQKVQRTGLYAPLTPSGTLVVDGVQASTYISLQPNAPEYVQTDGGTTFFFVAHHDLAHWFLAPFRLVCQSSASTICHSYNNQGMPPFVAFGIGLFRWLESLQLQYSAPQVLLSAIAGLYVYYAWSRLQFRIQIKAKKM